MLASHYGVPYLETISSNESRFTSSPNFLTRSKEGMATTQQNLITVPLAGRLGNQFDSISYSSSDVSGIWHF